MRTLLLIIKIVLALAFLIGLALGFFLLYSTLTDYRPDEKTEAESIEKSNTNIQKSELDLMIWNIGYAGLGAEIDFFYDGGTVSITPKPLVTKYLNGITSYLSQQKELDFILLQEVDFASKRSHYTQEDELIMKELPEFNSCRATNFKVKYVPKPFTNPLGRTFSGLQTLSPYSSVENTRYQFPGNFSWPVGLFFLDRCFLLQRYPVNGKELIVINTHNSAYDDGSLKQQQMDYLKSTLESEYAKGNYVIIGGDWNQTPPRYDNNTFLKSNGDQATPQTPVKEDYLQGWKWAADFSVPTNRKLSSPYNQEKTFTTVIDFFLVSPNIEILETKGVDLDFQYSDHQPVHIKIKLL